MKKILLFLLIATSLTGCRTLYLSELNPTEKYGNTSLPSLTPLIDVSSFETVFAANSTTTNSMGYMSGFNMGNTPYVVGNAVSTSSTFRICLNLFIISCKSVG